MNIQSGTQVYTNSSNGPDIIKLGIKNQLIGKFTPPVMRIVIMHQ